MLSWSWRSIKLLLLHLVGFYFTSPTLTMHGQTQIKNNHVSSSHVTLSHVVILTKSEQRPGVIACKVLPVCWSIGSTAQLSCSTSRHWHQALILTHCPSVSPSHLCNDNQILKIIPLIPAISNFVYKLTHWIWVTTAAQQSGINVHFVLGCLLFSPLNSRGHYMYHQFNIHELYVLSTLCIYVFCLDLRTNSDYFLIQH